MALSRKSLKAFGLSDDQIDSVVEMHAETVDGLKAQISELKETAAKLEVVTKERDELKATAEKSGDADKKYGDLKAEFDKYKKEIEDGQTRAKIETAYKSLLKSANIADKYIRGQSRNQQRTYGKKENSEHGGLLHPHTRKTL